MTIASSLAAGVSGLNANARRLATISDNIANSSTFGYKRAEIEFSSLVVPGARSAYTAGGVRTSYMRLIDERGPLIASSNATDLAVIGRGMLPATSYAAVNAESGTLPLHLMTTGSFRPDETGILTDQNGMVLMGWPADTNGEVGTFPRDTVSGLEPVSINVNQFAGDPTTEITISVNLPATETAFDASGDPQALSIEYFGNLGTSETLSVTFTPTIPATGDSNQWTMTLADQSSGGTVVAEYVLDFSDGRTDGGTLSAVATTLGNTYNPTTGSVTVPTSGGDIELSIGLIGGTSGLTQLSDDFGVVNIDKNGSSVGNLQSVEVDENGFLHALYDIGFSRTIYQIPLVDVPNPNGLISNSNQTYQVSPDSGAFFMWDAGDGPAGQIVGFSREESATDVANELTDLIQTQRAYSSNAKVIQTVDEMLQETTNIKR